ncbi:MAG: cytochrome d ubiquinol oxidase subunit II [Hyphomicrobium zavarzinii]|uniref:cytochrome d ubiquinol oxidase subunit II n=1 Tax=Hyphomicrobium zavarzinii TaxID=48292 RepID=UPI001A63C436|nr:cytochrome d ubiquinol oxidase subunit II [Hyphomicrobium zavarzinii]MBL8846837.1 cytochrome d ubiquinol oxidase subunit II [Hyphomicrobium zavarzinii]
MEDTSYWLPLIWVAILGVAVALYVVLDGFDLGIGILFPASPEEEDRDQMMNSVAPFWDGNETWLVLGGGGLLVAFPLAYSIIMPAVYLPVIIMLLALVFRGVAFEFRWVAKPHHQIWDLAFAGGSIVASFMQGIILGALLEGPTVRDGVFAGGTFDWLSPFSLLTGVAVVAGYALLGATWLVMKTDGEVQTQAREQAKRILPLVLLALVIVSLWTPFAVPRIFERWFTLPNFLILAPVPLLTAYAAWSCWSALHAGRDTAPFVSTIALFLLGFIGLAVSNLPYIVPPNVDVWQAAAHPSSQLFMLIGVLILLPVILAYTVFVYWTFRGKVRAGEGYH